MNIIHKKLSFLVSLAIGLSITLTNVHAMQPPKLSDPSVGHSDETEHLCCICLRTIHQTSRTGTQRFKCTHGTTMHYSCMDPLKQCPLCRADRITFPEDMLRSSIAHTCSEGVNGFATLYPAYDVANIRYGQDWTPLHLVAITQQTNHMDLMDLITFFAKQAEIIKTLIHTYQIDVNATDALGKTALHLALQMNNIPMALLLITEYNADTTIIENQWGFNARDLAKYYAGTNMHYNPVVQAITERDIKKDRS